MSLVGQGMHPGLPWIAVAKEPGETTMSHETPQGVLWVCSDCLFVQAYDEVNPDRPTDLPEVWSREPNTVVTLGMAWEHHAEDCPNRAAANLVDDCSCERKDFSTRACDACGDTHHGERHAYTWWA